MTKADVTVKFAGCIRFVSVVAAAAAVVLIAAVVRVVALQNLRSAFFLVAYVQFAVGT